MICRKNHSIINNILTICCLLLFTFSLYAQDDRVTFLDKQMREIINQDSAIYIRKLTPNSTPGAPYILTEYYKSGEVYRTGYAFLKQDNPVFTGMLVTQQKNGKKIQEEHFKNGMRDGVCRYYYKNGNLKSETVVEQPSDQNKSGFGRTPAKMKTFYDSLGTQLVMNGNGYVKNISSSDYEEGMYKDGFRDGLWKGSFMKKKYHFEEEYSNGQLLKGTTLDSAGQEYTYNVKEESPKYPKGMNALYKYIGEKYRMPRQAKSARVHGSVVLSFVIDKEGSVSDIKVLRELGHGTGKEGVRVMSKSKEWTPAKLRGIPVSIEYALPIKLNVGG